MMSLILIVCSTFTFAFVWGKVDFCAEQKFPETETSSYLKFTKELSESEYGLESKFKSLHCCSKGYRSIEWFKDGKPYPWQVEVSGFILYPESTNQTIYTSALRTSDAGEYSCTVRNESMHIVHTTRLTVFDKEGYMKEPLWTHKPAMVSLALPGGQARLFCEAFVGYIDLPDATNEVIWEKMGNVSFVDSRINVNQVQREGGEIVGAYLTINDVRKSDFEKYTCSISNTGDQRISTDTQLQPFLDESTPLKMGKASFIIGLIILTGPPLIACCFLKFFSKQSHHLFTSVTRKFSFKSSLKAEKNSKKTGGGIVLLYKSEDSDFVEKTLLPALAENSEYKVFPQCLTNEGNLTTEAKDMLCKVGREIIVLTPNVVKSWSQPSVIAALQSLVILPQHCIILLEPLPSNNSDCSFNFESLVGRYRTVRWVESGEVGAKAKASLLIKTLAGPQTPPTSCSQVQLSTAPSKDVKVVRPQRNNILEKIHLSKAKADPEAHV